MVFTFLSYLMIDVLFWKMVEDVSDHASAACLMFALAKSE